MKGKPSKVAKRRLHEPPKEFTEANKVRQTEKWLEEKRWWERLVARGQNCKMPSHPEPDTLEEKLSRYL